MTKLFKAPHLQNAIDPMLVTVFGIVTDAKDEQPQKTPLFPIVLTPEGITNDVIPEQYQNAPSPMATTG